MKMIRGNVTCQEVLMEMTVLSLGKREAGERWWAVKEQKTGGRESKKFILCVHGEKWEGMRSSLLNWTK